MARFFFEYGGASWRAVIGVDEVGRGSLFGPVSVGAVLLTEADWQVLPTEPWFGNVTDSKLLRRAKRDELAPLIEARLPCAVSHVSVRYIDTHNINRAIQYGLYRTVQALLKKTGMPVGSLRVIADGNYRFRYPALGMAQPMPRIDAEIKADLKFFPVSAASIVAKVRRDNLIAAAHRRFPEYGLDSGAGYGTAAHRAAITAHGQTRFHRRSFQLKSG